MKYAKILVTLFVAAAANSLATWYVVGAGTFSPNGSKVAYLSNDVSLGGSRYAIYTVNADGSGKVRFDLKERVWGEPYFSPDGKKVAFINAYKFPRNCNIFLVDVDGANPTQVTAYGDDAGARRHFEEAVATEARRYPEYILAQHELRRLDAARE
jgi:hypothetical protein